MGLYNPLLGGTTLQWQMFGDLPCRIFFCWITSLTVTQVIVPQKRTWEIAHLDFGMVNVLLVSSTTLSRLAFSTWSSLISSHIFTLILYRICSTLWSEEFIVLWFLTESRLHFVTLFSDRPGVFTKSEWCPSVCQCQMPNAITATQCKAPFWGCWCSLLPSKLSPHDKFEG